MGEFQLSPFRTTRNVQSQIQEFPDAVSMVLLAYQEGMIAYLKDGWREKRLLWAGYPRRSARR
jgi:hypothetical protein